MSLLQAFLDSDATELVLGPAAFEGSHLSLAPAVQSNALLVNESLHGIAQQLYQRNTYQCVPLFSTSWMLCASQAMAWSECQTSMGHILVALKFLIVPLCYIRRETQ